MAFGIWQTYIMPNVGCILAGFFFAQNVGDIDTRGQFHQHFWHQSRATLEEIIFDAFYGNSIWQNCAKYGA
jgi:hypothetical protein